jgi:hypothetical protein
MIPYDNPNPMPIETRFCILFAILMNIPQEYHLPLITIFFLFHLHMIEYYLIGRE